MILISTLGDQLTLDNALLKDIPKLTAILTYHVVSGKAME